MHYQTSVKRFSRLVAAWLLIGSPVLADDVITRDEMRPELYEFPRPLYCQIVKSRTESGVVYEGSFVLPWALLVEVTPTDMIFDKDGVRYAVPSDTGYVCSRLVG